MISAMNSAQSPLLPALTLLKIGHPLPFTFAAFARCDSIPLQGTKLGRTLALIGTSIEFISTRRIFLDGFGFTTALLRRRTWFATTRSRLLVHLVLVVFLFRCKLIIFVLIILEIRIRSNR